MATEVPVQAESELSPEPALAAQPEKVPATVETPVEVVPETKPVAVAEKTPVPEMKEEKSSLDRETPVPEMKEEKSSLDRETPVPEMKKEKSSLDRDVALAELEKEKKLSFIKAWEETEKSKVENKAQKELSTVTAWENTKRADIEAELKQIEEKFDKKKAEFGEKMKNKVGLVHKQAEEKRAMVEAKKGEDKLKAEELAAKYRATGTLPKKLIACFGA